MTNQTDKNRYLAERMGIDHWHEWEFADLDDWPECTICKARRWHLPNNPDYFTAEGRQELLEWGVEQEWWEDFKFNCFEESSTPNFSYEDAGAWAWAETEKLFIPVSALAEAVAKYLKEREDASPVVE